MWKLVVTLVFLVDAKPEVAADIGPEVEDADALIRPPHKLEDGNHQESPAWINRGEREILIMDCKNVSKLFEGGNWKKFHNPYLSLLLHQMTINFQVLSFSREKQGSQQCEEYSGYYRTKH
ncbi:hypothetical protein PIB30_023308 [Stylosanthes scabra]|uniref:Uncharacterized protein n=1 Tax=Stylosanthes scabra TaxID=79078 RepID=A0ABU6R9T4_9FABA|nr:hypothetical protein [Stylosanthes scabra]